MINLKTLFTDDDIKKIKLILKLFNGKVIGIKNGCKEAQKEANATNP